MNRRDFFHLFAIAGLSALAPKAFAVAQFVTNESELDKLLGSIRSFGTKPNVIVLPSDIWDQVAGEMEARYQLYTSADVSPEHPHVMIRGIPIIRGD